MDQNKLIQKIEESALQFINYFIVNIKKNDVESSNYIFELFKQLDLTKKLKDSYLFNIDARFDDELNKSVISEKLWAVFQARGFPLFYHMTVTKEKENEWVITDEKRLIIKKEDEKLNIHQEFSLKDLSRFIWNISDDESLANKYCKIIDDLDLIEKIEKSDLDSVNYLIWNLFQTSSTIPKIFTNEGIRNILINRLNEPDENIGEKLRLIGIFESAGYPILGKNNRNALVAKSSKSELEKWFSEYNNNPFNIALVLEGFRACNEAETLLFISSYLDLKAIINCLKKAEIKNRKSKQFIGSVLDWLMPYKA